MRPKIDIYYSRKMLEELTVEDFRAILGLDEQDEATAAQRNWANALEKRKYSGDKTGEFYFTGVL